MILGAGGTGEWYTDDMNDEIGDFGEEIEDMMMYVEWVAAELVNLQEEVKTLEAE